MSLEVELKFPVSDRVALVARLEQHGTAFQLSHREIDQYLQHPARDFRVSDEAVRLRSIGEENCLTYKGPKLDAQTKTRREIEFPIGPGAENRQLALDWLAAVGFAPVAVVAKTRTLGTLAWQGHEVTVALDRVDELGDFAELEVIADPHEMAAAKETILTLAAELHLGPSERRGYLQMLLTKAGVDGAANGSVP